MEWQYQGALNFPNETITHGVSTHYVRQVRWGFLHQMSGRYGVRTRVSTSGSKTSRSWLIVRAIKIPEYVHDRTLETLAANEAPMSSL